jgi:hypothetical protein
MKAWRHWSRRTLLEFSSCKPCTRLQALEARENSFEDRIAALLGRHCATYPDYYVSIALPQCAPGQYRVIQFAPTDFRSPLVLTMTVIELDLRLTNGRGSRSKRMTYAAVFSTIARKYVSQLAHQIYGLKPQPELVVT